MSRKKAATWGLSVLDGIMEGLKHEDPESIVRARGLIIHMAEGSSTPLLWELLLPVRRLLEEETNIKG